jgi:hypothetical protein
MFSVFCLQRAWHETDKSDVNADTNKTLANGMKLVEHLLDRGYILWLHFYNSPDVAQMLKSKGTDCVRTLCTNR